MTCNLAKDVSPLVPKERDIVLAAIADARRRLSFQVLAYVVMPDHWHALILPAPGQTISRVMQAIKRTATMRLNSCRGKRGPFWQARFFDRFLRSVQEFRDAVDYIHTNPVREGFVSDPAAWQWSSHSAAAAGRRSLLPVDSVQLPFDSKARI